MTSEGGRISPEVEFGTFLRLPHQSRTFSRPADSYVPSSPPSRPTSPPPASSAPSTVFLHGRPAPVVGKMRQGAPRLGGLGLGGIVESTPSAPPPPPLPARRQPVSSPSLPPAVPAASRSSASSRSGSPGDARPQTPNSAKLDSNGGGGNLPQRPFLSPEMDKPVAREGAFALDRPKVEDVLKRSSVEEDRAPSEEPLENESASGGLDPEGSETKGAASPEAFPSPEVEEEGTGSMFDRFKSTLGTREDEQSSGNGVTKKEGTDSDRGSINSTGESFFATPETVPADGEEEEEPIPNLVLNDIDTERRLDEEEIAFAFDGPTQLVPEEDENEPIEALVGSLPSQSTSFNEPPSQPTPALPSVGDSLLLRSGKSTSSEFPNRSPAGSVATSVYPSREPSIHNFMLESEKEERQTADETNGMSLKIPTTQFSPSATSPTYSQTSSLPDDLLSPHYTQGRRYLSNDPASEYPSPPSSPATSVQGPPSLRDDNVTTVVENLSVYSAEPGTKTQPDETEFIETSTQTPTLGGPEPVEPEAVASIANTESAAALEDPQPSEERSPSSPSSSILASPPASSFTTSPYFDRPRRSRFSYQGLGLRMPSSIAPKSSSDDEPDSQPDVSSPPAATSARSTSLSTSARDDPIRKVEERERPVDESVPKPVLFPWIQPPRWSTSEHEEEKDPKQPFEPVSGYRDESSNLSSPSAYAPSSVAPSPEISTAYQAPASSRATELVVSAIPDVVPIPSQLRSTSPFEVQNSTPSIEPSQEAPSLPVDIEASPAPTKPNEGTEPKEEEQTEEDLNQTSTVGVAVDIGTAVAGALVMGGLAVGQTALRGLAVGWSAWRGASNQSVIPETKVVEIKSEEEEKEFKNYVAAKERAEDSESSRKAESSVISTEWGEAEFEAPEGFLEEFKRAMAEIGEEDLAANEQAQIDAQLAAYEAASRQHVDAVSSPSPSDNLSLASSPQSFSSPRLARPREASSLRRQQPQTIEEDSADEDERELEDLMTPVWDSPTRLSRIAVEFPSRHGFAPPPGLTGSRPTSVAGSRPISLMSTSSMSSTPASPNPSAAPPASPRKPAKLSKTSKGILGFGRSKSTKDLSKKPASRVPPSPSLPGLSGTRERPQSMFSQESSKTTTANNDASSQHSKSSSHKTAGRRSSIFNFGGGKDVPPVPTIESQIKDTTYISYGSTTTKPQRRNSSASSISTGLYASRDSYLLTPGSGTVVPPTSSPSLNRRTREQTPSSITTSSSTRSDDPGGAPFRRRRSSLRATSAYDGGSSLTRSSSIVESEKKLYRVRFGNAMGGIGLRSVADDEAERSGGDRHGQRWVGIARGRYGNMIIKTDEESDMVYAEQVAQIKKKWRAFGSEQSRDWAAVRIDK
ncbi:uncharacterized protein JCM6883_002027 [Sporobolomyces salmoneus]|uniref:uncharacterized protein n=1 Tax=Sporobolomyces salmoneus TaxID=183962 RepID=UPI00316D660F